MMTISKINALKAEHRDKNELMLSSLKRSSFRSRFYMVRLTAAFMKAIVSALYITVQQLHKKSFYIFI